VFADIFLERNKLKEELRNKIWGWEGNFAVDPLQESIKQEKG